MLLLHTRIPLRHISAAALLHFLLSSHSFLPPNLSSFVVIPLSAQVIARVEKRERIIHPRSRERSAICLVAFLRPSLHLFAKQNNLTSEKPVRPALRDHAQGGFGAGYFGADVSMQPPRGPPSRDTSYDRPNQKSPKKTRLDEE